MMSAVLNVSLNNCKDVSLIYNVRLIDSKAQYKLPCVAGHWSISFSRSHIEARHDGLPHQLSPLLPVVCHRMSLCEGFAGTFRDVVNFALFLPAPSWLVFDSSQ